MGSREEMNENYSGLCFNIKETVVNTFIAYYCGFFFIEIHVRTVSYVKLCGFTQELYNNNFTKIILIKRWGKSIKSVGNGSSSCFVSY